MPETPAARPVVLLSASLLLSTVVGPSPLGGQEAEPDPLVTDRPDFTESAATVAPGRFQLEAGYTFTRSGDERQHEAGEALLRVGIGDPIELRLGVPSFTTADGADVEREGFGDASIGLKATLVEPATAGTPRTALLLGTSLPTGDAGIGSAGLQPGATVALAWDLPDGVGLGVNLGYESVEEEEVDFGRAKGSVAVGLPLAGPIGAFLEGFLLVPEGSRPEEPFLDGGVTWLVGPNLQLDARVGAGFEGPDPSYFAGAGLSARW